MLVTIVQKCDRSGRVENVQVESTVVAQYEQRDERRRETLAKIDEFLATIPAEDMPDLIAIYRGERRAFINVNATFCDKPVSRLLDQLFHASDPKKRAKRGSKKKQNGEITVVSETLGEPTVEELTP